MYMAFFSEHANLPDTTQYAVDTVAKSFSRVNQAQDPGWVREVGAEVIMTLDIARSFREWLDSRIAILEKIGPGDAFATIE